MTEDWKDGSVIPPVEIGGQTEYVVAVFRKRTGKVYSFSASYLNAYPLQYDDCPNPGCQNNCEDGCPTTGWFSQSGDDDYAAMFTKLKLDEGDQFMGWREIPKWPGAVPVAA